MRHIQYLASAISLAAFPVFADAVTIGTTETYDSGGYTIAPAALQEFERALGEALCQRAGVACEWSVLAPDRLWAALEAGDIDSIMAGISVAEDLGNDIDLTLPYLIPDPFLHIGLAGTEWQIEGADVAHLPDPAVTAYAQTTGATFTEYATVDAALGAVRSGQALSLFGERHALLPIVDASDGGFVVIGVRDEIRIKPGVAMAFRGDDIDLRFAFEDQIFEMMQDGSLNDLIESWFGVDAARW